MQRRAHTTQLDRNVIEDASQKRIIGRWISHADSCLEMGGGYGRTTSFIEPFFHKVAMADVSEGSLQLARTVLRKTSLVQGDASSIPMKDSSFDFIFMVKVVHLLRDPALAMREIQRVSKDQGILMMTIPNLPMNSLIRSFEERVSPKLRHILPTFGPAI
ncbi:MAG: class I SAM-dependent methyltransferase [Thaumarchaeota archaeon]|nr:class I SAM-dependent methyltransferase [Nitrososphaerota archaeon]